MNSINDIPAEILISKIVAANNDFISHQNKRQDRIEERYNAERKEILSEIKNICSELAGFKNGFILLSGEVSEIQKSILSKGDLQNLTFDCIEIYENKKIVADLERKNEITQTVELSKRLVGKEPDVPFYKKAAFIATSITAGAVTTALTLFKLLG